MAAARAGVGHHLAVSKSSPFHELPGFGRTASAGISMAAEGEAVHDQRLRVMLDQGTYELGSLERSTRVPLKRLAAAIGEGPQ